MIVFTQSLKGAYVCNLPEHPIRSNPIKTSSAFYTSVKHTMFNVKTEHTHALEKLISHAVLFLLKATKYGPTWLCLLKLRSLWNENGASAASVWL